MTAEKIFVDTDILIDVARKNPRALDFWFRVESKGSIVCSVISVFELLAGCRTLQEQRTTLKSLSVVSIVQIESGDSLEALQWYRSLHLARGVGFLDCLIAAAASRLGCVLHTANIKHFRVLPGLRIKLPY